MRQQESSNTLAIVAGLVIVVILYIAGITIPVSDARDVQMKITVSKPLIGSAKIDTISASASQHTFFQAPNMASILSSGTLKITAAAGSAKTSGTFGTILRTTSDDFKLTLSNIPKNQNTVTVQLFEDGSPVDTQTINIVEE